MYKRRVKVREMHGYTQEEIAAMANKTQDKKEKKLLLSVSMSLKGIKNEDIANILGISYFSVLKYINYWNKNGDYKTEDRRKNNNKGKGVFTQEVRDELYQVINTQSPKEYGYVQNSWNGKIIKDYLEKLKGINRSTTRVREVLHEMKLSYKKGVKVQNKCSKEDQENFKKNH